jgi:hypothetical protein
MEIDEGLFLRALDRRAVPHPGIETMLTLNNPLFDLTLFTILFWQTNLSD